MASVTAPRATAGPAWRKLGPAGVGRVKAVFFVLALLPFLRLFTGGLADAQGWSLGGVWAELLTLGTNPVELITRSTGTWTLATLCLALAVTPLRRLTGANWLARMRRMTGLFAFFYAALHFTAYAWFDQGLYLDEILKDVWKRPFITVGFAAFLLLVPLAITSTDAMMRRLGRRWATLHRAVYAVAVLGVVHYWWLVKRDLTQPALYAMVVAVLLGARVAWMLRGAVPPSTVDRRS